MKFYRQHRLCDCFLSGIEFLLQKDRSSFDSLIYYAIDVPGYPKDEPLVWVEPTIRNFPNLKFARKHTKHKNKLLQIRWPGQLTTHIICQRGKTIYDSYKNRKYKSWELYCKSNGGPRVISSIYKGLATVA